VVVPEEAIDAPAAAPKARTRRGYMLALVVVLVAWGAGLLGAWMGVRWADDDRAPARQASTLGLVTVPPRAEPLPTLDVYAAASAVGPAVVSISTFSERNDVLGQSTGSGVIITADGEIVTNAHVVAGAVTISVRIPGETEPRGAVVVASDPSRDLALLRIDADGLLPATFADPADIRVGDGVVAVGYALGLDGDPSVTAGIVSALDRTSADDTLALKGLIQTDTPISSGNSGGPLVNALGEVVGIVTFVATSPQDGTATNLGFAISNAELLPAIDELRAAADGGLAANGFLGVSLADRVDGGSGALVTEVVADSPAAQAGLEVGDVIVAIDDAAVTGRDGLVATIRRFAPGDQVEIGVMRGGEAVTLRATLVERPAD
jgi:S1-C subfamily serine protease